MTDTEWLTFGGVAVTAVLGFVGARATARSARASSARSAELDSFRLQLSARDDQVTAWRTDAESLRQDRDELGKRVDDLGDQLSALITWARTVATIMRMAHVDFPEPPATVHLRGK